MRSIFYLCLIVSLVSNVFGLPKYTYQMTEDHLRLMMETPYVTPTVSCDPAFALPGYENDPLADFVIGTTPGNDPSNPDPPNHSSYNYCPPHNIYAYKISDPTATGPKVNVVIISGIHGSESNGTWAFQGMEDFCASDEPAAVNLRQIADIFVYPLCNPDGRYLGNRGNPELRRMLDDGLLPDGRNDMNRVWHLNGHGLSTIDALVPAILEDTGGQAEYMFDFHAGSSQGASWYYTIPSLYDCPFAIEFAALHPTIPGEPRPVGPSLSFRPGDYRMTRVWALRPDYLNARYGFTPENTGKGTTDDRKALGRLYGLATYNAIVSQMASPEVINMKILAQNWLKDNRID